MNGKVYPSTGRLNLHRRHTVSPDRLHQVAFGKKLYLYSFSQTYIKSVGISKSKCARFTPLTVDSLDKPLPELQRFGFVHYA